MKTQKPRVIKAKYNVEFPTHKYAQMLVDGDIVACKCEVQLAKIHLKNLKRQGTKAFPYVFDESRAMRFFKFFEICRNPDNGQYYKILPHQMFDNGLLFGWVHKDTGIRKYKKRYAQEARGQAKTTSNSIKAMFMLSADKLYPPNKPELGFIIQNARIDLMAVDKQQADELREPIVAISRCSPKLLSQIDAGATFIRGKNTGGKIYVLSKDLANKQGAKPNMVAVDELSSFADSKRLAAVEKGFGKKAQTLIDITTTPNDNEESNPAKKEYDYAKKVLFGEVKDEESYLPIIRECEDGDDIHSVEVWQKANPMFRYCGEYAYSDTLFAQVKSEYERAYKVDDLEQKRQFAIFRLGRWQERSVKSFLNEKQMKQLDSLAVSHEEFANLTFGRKKIVGFDFAVRRDLSADADVFLLDDGKIAVDVHAYILEETIAEKEQSDRVPYRDWINQGYITSMDYPATNKRIVAQDFLGRAEQNEQEIKMACFDPAHARDLMMDLIDGVYGDGQFNEENCIMITQNANSLNDATVLLKNSIITGNFVWNGNQLFRWFLQNCFEFENKFNAKIRVGKENKDSPRRIDGVAAAIAALAMIDVLKQENGLQYALYSGNFRFS